MPANSPKWANAAHTAVDLLIDHPEFGEIPFTASSNDIESRGQDLFELASNREFGPVAPYVPPPEPPITVDPSQLRRALNAQGLRDAVEAAVAAHPDRDVRDYYEYNPAFREDHPLVISICQAIGKTDAERRALFVLAKGL